MILSCQNITKTFGTDVIIQNASFHIEEYEKAAIVGINGAGKSTLLKIIVGELEPDEGVVAVSKEKTIGYLAQNEVIDSARTIYEEVLSAKQPVIDMELEIRRMENRMDSVPASELEAFMEKYERLIHQFELADGYTYRSEVTSVLNGLGFSEADFSKTQAELSGGQKRRVAIAGVLAMEPEVLILDEPTAGLDPKGRDEILDQIARIHNERHITVILVSHSMEDVAKYVGRIIVMDHGMAVYDGAPKEVFSHYKELEQIGLAAPQVTYAMHALRERGIPVTTEATTVMEAGAAILAVWKEIK